MHVLVALPGKSYLDALSPLFEAMGERVVPVIGTGSAGRKNERQKIMAAFRAALQNDDSPALFPTVFATPWPVFEALLRGDENLQALVFYEPAAVGIARQVQAGAQIAQACEAWVARARNCCDFISANKGQVILIGVDGALSKPAEWLSVCANRFLFDLTDVTVKPEASKWPHVFYRMVSEIALNREATVADLDRQLAQYALPLMRDQGGENLREVDFLIDQYKSLEADAVRMGLLEDEAQSFRKAHKLAEEEAQSLLMKLEAGETKASADRPETELESELKDLKTAMRHIQFLAETRYAEAIDLQVEREKDRREILRLKAMLKVAESRDVSYSAGDDAGKLTREDVAVQAPQLRRGRTLNPRKHLQLRRDIALVAKSGLFDAAWYLERNEDVRSLGVDPIKHYVCHGGQEGRAAGPAFSSRRYNEANSDVAKSGLNPLIHYLRFGKVESREIFRSE